MVAIVAHSGGEGGMDWAGRGRRREVRRGEGGDRLGGNMNWEGEQEEQKTKHHQTETKP